MAKVKKTKVMSLEEVLLPVDEQPYKVPENWCWTKMESVCGGFQYGYTEKAVYEKIGPKYIRITDIGDGVINDEKAPYCPIDDKSYESYKIHKDDIFIARMGSVGENGLALTDLDAVFASYLIRLIPKISAKFITFYLQSGLYWGQISEKSQGTTRLNVNANVLKTLMFPLPPLEEQKRIVEQIESMFVKLDEAKEKVQEALDSSDIRMTSILHEAFTGKLTEKWRSRNNYLLEEWEYKKLGDTSIKIIDGDRGKNYPKKDEFTDSGYCIFLNAKNVTKNGFNFETLECITKEKDELLHNGRLERGDMIMTTRGTIGNVAIYDDSVPYEHLRINSGMVIYRGERKYTNRI